MGCFCLGPQIEMTLKGTIIFLALLLLGGISEAQSVYKTPSGKKYHLSTCRMVKNVSEKITIEQAMKLGLEPCKICNPGTFYSAAPANSSKAQGQDQSVQCRGLTKAGTRCKHMTRIANGYCFQHQPK